MSNNINVQDYYLLDQDENLPVEESIVAKFIGVISNENQGLTIQQLIIDNDIKTAIATHNEKRVKTTDKGILKRTGKKVNLEPVTIKDLTWLAK